VDKKKRKEKEKFREYPKTYNGAGYSEAGVKEKVSVRLCSRFYCV
jgi:hypothetical protein